MTEKKVPHKHAELIKAWADGAIIQYKCGNKWQDVFCNSPSWRVHETYRVKPEPKPDRIETRKLTYDSGFRCIILNGEDNPNIQFVFDGETGKLKDAQVLAQE